MEPIRRALTWLAEWFLALSGQKPRMQVSLHDVHIEDSSVVFNVFVAGIDLNVASTKVVEAPGLEAIVVPPGTLALAQARLASDSGRGDDTAIIAKENATEPLD